MTKEDCIEIVKGYIENMELDEFKGFDLCCDSFWSGNICREIKFTDGTFIEFDGEVEFNIDENGCIADVGIDVNFIEYFDSECEIIEFESE